jgi:uracil-DNA glycosylase
MQPRVLYMLNQLGIPPGQSPASNVVFLRTAREAQLKREFSALAELCWPFHAAAISGLKPRLVTCFGKTAGGYVRAKLKADKLVSEYVEQNSRRWKSSLFRNDGGLHVLVATHPSIAAWNSAQSDPTCLARQALA